MSGSKSKQFPPQQGAYAVKVKNGAGWTAFSTARFHISVGQAYHEGDKFAATMAWAATRFKKVVICVNDTLQRFNHEFEGTSREDAFVQAEAAGREWLERNIRQIRRAPRFEIHRWEDWRRHRDFPAELARINDLYANDVLIRRAIEDEVETFWLRRQQRSASTDNQPFLKFAEFSTRYLIEECAAFSLMFQADHAVDIYPGSTLLPCRLFKGETSLGDHAFTRIDFARNERPTPPLLRRDDEPAHRRP